MLGEFHFKQSQPILPGPMMAAAAVDMNEKVISMNLDIMDEQRVHMHLALDHYVDEVIDAGRQWTTSRDRNRSTFLDIYKVISQAITFLSLKSDEMKREQLSCLKRESSHLIGNDELRHQQNNLLMDSGVHNNCDFPTAEPVTAHEDGEEDDTADVRNTHTSGNPNLECDQQTRYPDLYNGLKNSLGKQDGVNRELNRKLENLRDEVASLKSDVGNVNQCVKSGNTFKEDCSQKIAFLESVVSYLSGNVDDINSDLSAHIGQVQTDLSDKVDKINTDLSDKVDKINTDLSDKVDKINTDLSDKVDKINTDLSDKVDKINSDLSAHIVQVQADLLDKAGKLNMSLSLNMVRVQADLSVKVDQLDTNLSGNVDKINTELSAHIVQVQTGLSDKVDQLDVDLSAHIVQVQTSLSDKVDQLDADRSDTVNIMNTDMLAKVDQINTYLSEKVHEIDGKLSATVDQVNKVLESLPNCGKEHAVQVTKIIDLENRCLTMEKDTQNNVKQVQQQLEEVGTNYTVIRELLVKRLEPLEKLRDILNDRAMKQTKNVRQNHLEPQLPPI